MIQNLIVFFEGDGRKRFFAKIRFIIGLIVFLLILEINTK